MEFRKSRFVLIVLILGLTTGTVRASVDSGDNKQHSVNKAINLGDIGITERISVNSNGIEGNGASSMPSISGDGRFIAFWSEADNLVSGDTNETRDIFVHDQQNGQITRVSVASDGSQGNNSSGSYGIDISSDGRFVAFESHASNLVLDDLNDDPDIFVHNRETGQTTIVSVSTAGSLGNAESYSPSISADGRYIAFHSNASNLVPDDTNNMMDVFVNDHITGETSRVSVASDGTQGDYHSLDPSISGDGRYVAFASTATNFASAEQFLSYIYIHDRDTGQTSLVSVDSEGTPANSYSFGPSISGNGRYVSFTSGADNLVSGDVNESDDVFIHDFQSGQTILVSIASNGTQGNNDSADASVSNDGRYIAFGSRADNLAVGNSNNYWNVFLHDMQSKQTELISLSTINEIGNRGGAAPKISLDGNHIVYFSDSDNLVCGDNNTARDIFLRDRFGPVQLHSISGKITTPQMKPIPNVKLSNGKGDERLTDGNGNYLFEQLLPCSYVITPSLDEYVFSPPSKLISIPPSIENQDFKGELRVYSFLPSITRNYCGSSYEDDFSDPTSGWLSFENENVLLDYFNGEYRMMVKQADWWAAVRPSFKAENFDARVQVRNQSQVPGSYGIVFNIAEDWSHMYTFEIDSDGFFGIWRYSDTEGWKLLLVNHSQYINLGNGVNQLRVKRDGAQINIYANNHLLASISDSTFTGKHYLGLIISSFDQSYLDVRFDNFSVTPSECGDPSTLSVTGFTGTSTSGPQFMFQEASKDLH